ncbi:hypothetical protein OLY31_02250, partial [Campylobacter jejuni]|nr:hypothetical protein [Campylobacter jejuni]
AMQNALRQQAINARQQKDEILAGQAILNLPSYTKSNPEMRAIQERFNTIKKVVVILIMMGKVFLVEHGKT